MSKNIDYYNNNAETLDNQYQQVTFEEVHQPWKKYWPNGKHSQCTVLDIGAGSGLNAKWLAEQNCTVYAVEPATKFAKLGEQRTAHLPVTWINDSLPSLKTVEALNLRFDYILLSAVWMHIAVSDRKRAFRKLANLLAPKGKLIFTLRHGEFQDGRVAHPVSKEELERLAKDYALHPLLAVNKEKDKLNRADVKWETVVFALPDDGSGDLVTVRHIIVNDAKSSTYKLALLRSLLRIADSHPGSVIAKIKGRVYLPLGLVALYWIKLYKRLIDVQSDGITDIQQNSATSKGLAFIKDTGWEQLKSLSPDDLCIGAIFTGDKAIALHNAINHSIAAIKNGPVTFTYQGDKDNKLFTLNKDNKLINLINDNSQKKECFVINAEFLQSFGHFSLEESLWNCLRLYASWIDPLLVNQWITVMKGYERNQSRNISLQTYHDRLMWLDKKHNTQCVRKRIDALRKGNIAISSAWSKTMIRDDYQVDHCLPFSYWPNNDKWNLLPATRAENNQKLNRVPSKTRLLDSKQRILNFWELAWENDNDQTGFFTQAALSLPGIRSNDRDFEAVYEAMKIQIAGVRSRLLINEW